jgi:hypothetical protein
MIIFRTPGHKDPNPKNNNLRFIDAYLIGQVSTATAIEIAIYSCPPE